MEPNFGGMPNIATSNNSSIAETAVDYQDHIDLLRAHLSRAQARMKAQADRKRTER